jgi:hypothetical protein
LNSTFVLYVVVYLSASTILKIKIKYIYIYKVNLRLGFISALRVSKKNKKISLQIDGVHSGEPYQCFPFFMITATASPYFALSTTLHPLTTDSSERPSSVCSCTRWP